MREAVQSSQQCLHVGQVIDQVGQQNAIEPFVAGKLLGVGRDELQLRMALARQVDDRRAEIHADAAGGANCGQEIAQAAAEFQDTQARREQETEVAF